MKAFSIFLCVRGKTAISYLVVLAQDASPPSIFTSQGILWFYYTVFRRINAPGAEAQNKPLILSDFIEIDYVTSRVPRE